MSHSTTAPGRWHTGVVDERLYRKLLDYIEHSYERPDDWFIGAYRRWQHSLKR